MQINFLELVLAIIWYLNNVQDIQTNIKQHKDGQYIYQIVLYIDQQKQPPRAIYKQKGKMSEAHNYLEQNNMGHPQRRRIYNLNNRHNLKSNIQLAWMQSLQSNNKKNPKVIQQKRTLGLNKAIDTYNSYVDKQLQNLFSGDNFATVVYNNDLPKLNEYRRKQLSIIRPQFQMSNSKIYTNRNNNSEQNKNKRQQILDKSLNQQLQHFNQKPDKNDLRRSLTISNQYSNTGRQSKASQNDKRYSQDKSRFKQQAYTLSPKFLKQMILRSALDRPEIYNTYQGDSNTIRNFKPDNLQTYLRANQKKNYIYR